MANKKKDQGGRSITNLKLDMTFEEAMKKALNTPLPKKKDQLKPPTKKNKR